MIHRNIIYTNFSKWRFEITRAEGSYIWDQVNNRKIDFTSEWNVTNLGWNHPEISQAIRQGLDKNLYASMWFSQREQEKYAAELTKVLPKKLSCVSRATGGAEANEQALKVARVYTGRKKILGFRCTYHGENISLLSLGQRPEWVEKIVDQEPGGFKHIDYPGLDRNNKSESEILEQFEKDLEEILKHEDVAAIMTEAGIVTGWGNTRVAPTGFLTVVRRLTEKYGTLLILDEVGTGFSRTGKLFAFEHENVIPDMITLAKGMSNGAAVISTMVTTEEIADKTAAGAMNGSTFGWLPLSVAAARKTLELHQKLRLWEKASESGHYLMKTLKEQLKDHPSVGDIRGMGMLICLDLVRDKDSMAKNPELLEKIVTECWEKGLHLVCDHESNIQIMPPLTIEREVLDEGIGILVEAVKNS